jgi:hypothetical protein
MLREYIKYHIVMLITRQLLIKISAFVNDYFILTYAVQKNVISTKVTYEHTQCTRGIKDH